MKQGDRVLIAGKVINTDGNFVTIGVSATDFVSVPMSCVIEETKAPQGTGRWWRNWHLRRLFAILLLFAGAASAQTTHKAILTWTDTLNPTGTTYSVYRAPGLCSGTPVFAKLATGLTAMTYTDSTVTPGNFCFAVTATSNGVESAQSNSVLGSVPAFSPSGLQVTVQ